MIRINERLKSPWLGLAITFQLLDLLTFALVLPQVGIGAESNPFMAGLYGILGLFGVVLMKAALIAYLILILPRLRILGGVAIALTGGIGLLGTMTNLLSWWITR